MDLSAARADPRSLSSAGARSIIAAASCGEIKPFESTSSLMASMPRPLARPYAEVLRTEVGGEGDQPGRAAKDDQLWSQSKLPHRPVDQPVFERHAARLPESLLREAVRCGTTPSPFDAGRWPNRKTSVGPMAPSDRQEQARPPRHEDAIELPADEVEDYCVSVAFGALIDGDPLGLIGSHNGDVGQEMLCLA